MKYCGNLRKAKENGYVILNNASIGSWIKLTEECYEYVNECIEK